MADTQGQLLDLIFGRWRSQILYAGVKLGVFDSLRGDAKTSEAVARDLRLDADLTYRLLRALGSLELLHEGAGRTFSLTEAGQFLRADHPETMRGVALLEEGPEHYALWKHLPAMIQEGTQNAFMREFGRMAFDHAGHDASYAATFDAAMTSYSRIQAALVLEALDGYDFTNITQVCDVGGGHGYMLCRLLERYPHLKGTVLERPSVIADADRLWATKLGLQSRCRYVAGNMFEGVPEADLYVMKLILHDWNDDECVQILAHQRSTAPPGGRVFIIEHILPGPETPHFAKLFDIHMMCWGTGRERTEAEYTALLERAGWQHRNTLFPPSRLMGVVEGAKA